MPKQHNALYGDDLHNPKGMTVDSHASSSKFVISASNMTITASGFTVKATAFQGDGSGLTGVPANDWDGTHSGNGVITGNLEVQGNSSGSITSTGSWGKVEATKFSGDGSGITGVTAEWDGSHTGTATFTGNVTASGVVSASGGFIGDGSNLTGVITDSFSDGTATRISGSSVSTGSFDKLVFDGNALSAGWTSDVPLSDITLVGTSEDSATVMSGLAENDILIYALAVNSGDIGASDSGLISAGWTHLLGASYSTYIYLRVYYKKVTSSVDTSFPRYTGGWGKQIIMAFRSVEPDTIFDVSSTTSAGNYATYPDPPSITTANNSSIVIAVGGTRSVDITGGPSGYGNYTKQKAGSNAATAIAWKKITSAGAENPGAFTADAGNSAAASIALRRRPATTETTYYDLSTLGQAMSGGVSGSSVSTGSFGRVKANAGLDVTGNITVTGTVDTIDIATRDAILTSTTTTAGAALPKAGGAMTGAITTNSTFDGVDIATRDGILTSTTTTAGAALPKAGGTMTGELIGTSATFTGDITAKNYIVSSSVTYMTQSFSSGSTIFGDTISDTHQFTGSILVGSGSISGSSTSTASFGTFVGDGSNLTGVGGGGLTHNFSTSQSLAAGDGVIINADGWVKKVEQETVAKKIPMKTSGNSSGTWYNSAGYQYDSGNTNTSKFLAYDPDTADRFIIAWGDSSNSNRGEACVGTITADDDNGIITYGGVATFDSANMTLFGCEFVPGSSTKFVVCYREDATDKTAARVGTISGTAPNETISFGTEAIMTNPNACWNARIVMDPEDTTNGTFVIVTQAYITGADNSGSAYVGSVSGTDITYGPEYQYDSSALSGDPHIDADPQGGGKFCIIYSTASNLLSKIATRSGTALTFGSAATVGGNGLTMYGLAYDPNTANSLICSFGATHLIAGIQSGTSVSWGTANTSLYNTGGGGTIRFHPSVAGEWVMAHQLYTNNSDGVVTRGTLSGTTITTGTSSTYRDKIVDSSFAYPNIKFDNVTAGKFTVMFGSHGGYEQTTGRCSVGRITSTSTNLTTSNWSGMATGVTAISGSASITTRGGIASAVTGSGLVPGSVYYLQGDSSLATTADTPSVKAGRALSATDILLTPETTS